MTGNRYSSGFTAETPSAPKRGRLAKTSLTYRRVRLVLIILLVGGLALGVFFGRKWLQGQPTAMPPIIAEQCLAMAGDRDVQLDLEQAKNAAIIVGTSVRMRLPARAASIAIATAWQESNLRNLDYGDRDSVGLFQQRPSQGWGTVEQLTDPVFAAQAFYKALVKVPKWETGDINDVAQKVQISAVPDGYRKWVDSAKTVASALTGHSPGGFSCLARSYLKVDQQALADEIKKIFGDTVIVSVGDGKVTISSNSPEIVWAASSAAIAFSDAFGLTKVTVGSKYWEMSPLAVVVWKGTDSPNAKSATLEFG